jgi:hypothetical protein
LRLRFVHRVKSRKLSRVSETAAAVVIEAAAIPDKCTTSTAATGAAAATTAAAVAIASTGPSRIRQHWHQQFTTQRRTRFHAVAGIEIMCIGSASFGGSGSG